MGTRRQPSRERHTHADQNFMEPPTCRWLHGLEAAELKKDAGTQQVPLLKVTSDDQPTRIAAAQKANRQGAEGALTVA